MNYRLLIQYDGTRYYGWQRQNSTDATIQGKIEVVLSRLEGRPVEIHGAGRTDAGVHALGQVANVHLTERPAERNPELPEPVSAGRHRNYRSKAGLRAIPQPAERLGESIRIPPGHRSGASRIRKKIYDALRGAAGSGRHEGSGGLPGRRA